MKRALAIAMGALLSTMSSGAYAVSFTWDGNIVNHNDVARIDFSLTTEATGVRAWTDSYMNATNFDPIIALWSSTGALIVENDENPWINYPLYDSGFALSSLAAGDYFFTIATYPNWTQGNNYSDGFRFDGAAPIALANWCQPANPCSMGTYWRLNLDLDGVDSTPVSAVPVPAAAWLFGTGLLGWVGTRRRALASA